MVNRPQLNYFCDRLNQANFFANQAIANQEPPKLVFSKSEFAKATPLSGVNIAQKIDFKTQHWTAYRSGKYELDPKFIDQQAASVFSFYDPDMAGTIETKRIPMVLDHIFAYLGMERVQVFDTLFLLYTFDKTGYIDLRSFKSMLKMLSRYQ